MLHEPTELLSLDHIMIVLDKRFNRASIAFQLVQSIRFNLVFARSAILLAEKAAFSPMHLVKLITVHVV